jgi:hypothetical protein
MCHFRRYAMQQSLTSSRASAKGGRDLNTR